MTRIDNQEDLVRCERCSAPTIAAYRLDEDGRRFLVLMCPACGREEVVE